METAKKNDMVSSVPEIITIYLNHNTPFQSSHIPPKVKMVDIKGSISKKLFKIGFIGTLKTISPIAKKISENEITCE